jgi:hypothetical protein
MRITLLSACLCVASITFEYLHEATCHNKGAVWEEYGLIQSMKNEG